MVKKLKLLLGKPALLARKLQARVADLIEPHQRSVHEGHNLAHLVYFVAVAVEGHGFYALMGLVLFVIGAVSWLADLEV